MTELEVMRRIISELDGISVPVILTQQIAVPLAKANAELKALHNAIVDALKRQDTKPEDNGKQKEAESEA